MEYWSVHPLHIYRAVLHPGRDIKNAAFIKGNRLVFQPELYLAAQIGRIVEIAAEKGKKLVKGVYVRLRPDLVAGFELLHLFLRYFCGLGVDSVRWKKPETLGIKCSGSHLAVYIQHMLQ